MRKKIFILLIAAVSFLFPQCASSQFTSFVVRKNDKLYDNDKEL